MFHLTSKFLTTSHRHRLTDVQGKPIWALRRRHLRWPRQWTVTTPRHVQLLHLHPRGHVLHAHFLDASHHHDAALDELFFAGPLVPGCTLHRGSSAAGPVVARVEAGALQSLVAAGTRYHRMRRPRLSKMAYRLRVAKGFDMAAACAVCVAMDTRRSTHVTGKAWIV